MIVDLCPQFLYFILDYSFLFFNRVGVGPSILSNFTNSSPSFCGMCDSRHISKPSEVWCRECEEGLCTECTEYHSSVKLSRGLTELELVPLFCLILPIVSIISLIKCSVSWNILDVFTFFIISSMIATFLHSLWSFRIQIYEVHSNQCD
jgi:hypothetical protein